MPQVPRVDVAPAGPTTPPSGSGSQGVSGSAPGPDRRPVVLAVLVTVLVVALVGGGLWFAVGRPDGERDVEARAEADAEADADADEIGAPAGEDVAAARTAATPTAPPSAAPTLATTTTRPAPVLATTTTVVVSPIEAARAELARLRDADRAEAEAQLELWVPQVSSKYVGLEADGIRYDEASILADHERWAGTYAAWPVVLVWSGDYTTFKNPDFWVTIVAQGYLDAEGANGWCDQQGIGPDDCFAKRLSHTAGHEGATVSRQGA